MISSIFKCYHLQQKNLGSFFVLLHIFVHEYLQTQYAFFHCLSVQFYFGIYDFKTNLSLSRLARISEIKEDPTVKYSLVNTLLCLQAISMWLNCNKNLNFYACSYVPNIYRSGYNVILRR